jgi:hypothetical protein
MATWFEQLTGFAEESHAQVHKNISHEDGVLVSRPNGRSMVCGRLASGLGDDAYYTAIGNSATLSVKKGSIGFWRLACRSLRRPWLPPLLAIMYRLL